MLEFLWQGVNAGHVEYNAIVYLFILFRIGWH